MDSLSPDEYRGEIPKAFIVLKEDKNLTENDIKDKIEGKIAKYKVPRQIAFKKELPKTGIGKIDRKALRNEN